MSKGQQNGVCCSIIYNAEWKQKRVEFERKFRRIWLLVKILTRTYSQFFLRTCGIVCPIFSSNFWTWFHSASDLNSLRSSIRTRGWTNRRHISGRWCKAPDSTKKAKSYLKISFYPSLPGKKNILCRADKSTLPHKNLTTFMTLYEAHNRLNKRADLIEQQTDTAAL